MDNGFLYAAITVVLGLVLAGVAHVIIRWLTMQEYLPGRTMDLSVYHAGEFEEYLIARVT